MFAFDWCRTDCIRCIQICPPLFFMSNRLIFVSCGIENEFLNNKIYGFWILISNLLFRLFIFMEFYCCESVFFSKKKTCDRWCIWLTGPFKSWYEYITLFFLWVFKTNNDHFNHWCTIRRFGSPKKRGKNWLHSVNVWFIFQIIKKMSCFFFSLHISRRSNTKNYSDRIKRKAWKNK